MQISVLWYLFFLYFSVFVSILNLHHGHLLCSAGEPGVSIYKTNLIEIIKSYLLKSFSRLVATNSWISSFRIFGFSSIWTSTTCRRRTSRVKERWLVDTTQMSRRAAKCFTCAPSVRKVTLHYKYKILNICIQMLKSTKQKSRW